MRLASRKSTPRRLLAGLSLRAILSLIFVFSAFTIIGTAQAVAAMDQMPMVDVIDGFSDKKAEKKVAKLAGKAEGKVKKPKYVEGDVLVKFKAGTTQAGKDKAYQNAGTIKLKQFKWGGWQHLRGKHGQTTEELIRILSSDPDVEAVEPNPIHEPSGIPNDPLFKDQWGAHSSGKWYPNEFGFLKKSIQDIDIKAPEAWDIPATSNEIIVAVIDTGVDYNHEDLAANMWVNPGESGQYANNKIDDDGNGYVDDVHGIYVDTVEGRINGNPMGSRGHGTHVAGTIAAVANNGIGVAGISRHAKIMAINFFGHGATADAITGIEYAVAHGARVINASWGTEGFSQALQDAISAARAAGVLFVASAGNYSTDNDSIPRYPTGLSDLISVAASDDDDRLAGFSNFGQSSTDLAAPGDNIVSTMMKGPRIIFDAALNRHTVVCDLCSETGYLTISGTSMAVPHVAGAAAEILAYDPALTPDAVKAILMGSTDKPAGLDGLTVSNGRLNLYQALASRYAAYFDTDLVSLSPGGSTTHRVTIRSLQDFATTLTLSAKSDPEIFTSFNTSTVSLPARGSSEVQLTLTASTTATGLHPVTISASGIDGELLRSGTLQLLLPSAAPANFEPVAEQEVITIAPGASTVLQVDVPAFNGYTGRVSLSASTGHSGIMLNYDAGSVVAGNSSRLNITTLNSVPFGTYILHLVASDGIESRQQDVTLHVSGADLIITALSAAPASVTEGDEIFVSGTVTNQGTSSTAEADGTNQVFLRLSNDYGRVLNIGHAIIGSVAAGESVPFAAAVVFRSGSLINARTQTVAPGDYFISGEVNPRLNAPETTYDNNAFTASEKTITVVETSAGLTDIDLSVEPGHPTTAERNLGIPRVQAYAGGSATFKLYFNNSTTRLVDSSRFGWVYDEYVYAPTSKANLYLRPLALVERWATSIIPEDIFIGSANIPGFFGYGFLELTHAIPTNVPMGDYVLVYEADPDNSLSERSETNNITSTSGLSPVTIAVPSGTAVDDIVTVYEGIPTRIPVLANDLFDDPSTALIVSVTQTASGNARVDYAPDRKSVIFAAEPGVRGALQFDYTLGGGGTATVYVKVVSRYAYGEVDQDGDGVMDDFDNCTFVANADQRDTNGDGYGNLCDPDLDNNGIVNTTDKSMFSGGRGLANPEDADLDGNGILADGQDFAIYYLYEGKRPGPGAIDNAPQPVSVAAPMISPLGGGYRDSVEIALATATAGASIYYTIDGSTPTAASVPYSGPFTMTVSATIKAIAIHGDYLDSGVTSADFTIMAGTGGGTIAPDSDGDGFADDVDNCTLVANANQRDTNGDGYGNICDGDLDNDGDIDSDDRNLFVVVSRNITSDPRYSAQLRQDADFDGDGVITGVDDNLQRGWLGSSPGPSASEYVPPQDPQVSTPVISPVGGSYSGSVLVSLSTGTTGTTIYYTLDGSSPSGSSLLYGGPFSLTSSATVKVIAVKANYLNSAIVSANFTITTGGGSALDYDGDGVIDDFDNCTRVANADQRDTNNDGYGNMCDGDLDNNGMVDAYDESLFLIAYRSITADPNYAAMMRDGDYNGDGLVNRTDWIMMSPWFGLAPGPSGLAP